MEPFHGNPAGVVLLEKPRDEEWMQSFAAEMRHAETAFLVPEEGGFHLRWFSPVREVDLCGHATLASAHALWETGTLKPGQEARFRTRSGTLTARQTRVGIEMDFPAQPPTPVEECNLENGAGLVSTVVTHALSGAVCEAIFKGLRTRSRYVGRNDSDYLVELDSEAAVRAVVPDYPVLATVDTRGVIVTAASDRPEYDFVSRFFAPAYGVDEDPVTGSAHCCLGPYWGAKLGKKELVGYQASPRGGTVGVVLRGDRVGLVGKAVTVLRGTIAG
jgi:PhzF family phenazine biosynthesis protein